MTFSVDIPAEELPDGVNSATATIEISGPERDDARSRTCVSDNDHAFFFRLRLASTIIEYDNGAAHVSAMTLRDK